MTIHEVNCNTSKTESNAVQVYCRDCKHWDTMSEELDICKHPLNIRPTPTHEKGLRCNIANKNNDCTLYERKFSFAQLCKLYNIPITEDSDCIYLELLPAILLLVAIIYVLLPFINK
jgi:hypothetical protein